MDESQTPQKPPPPAAAPSRWNWVPIRSLSARQRGRIGAHLLALDESDRYLRFGHAASDTQIQKYVDLLDFEHDEIFGIFNRKLQLIAMAHLAFQLDNADGPATMAEFGVSVAASARGRGFGQRLFEHAMLHARNRGVRTLQVHALSENKAMLAIARKLGGKIVHAGPESEARVELPPDSLASHLDELVSDNAAELDYQLKSQGARVRAVLDVIAEVRSRLGEASNVGES